ncbi:uncharacterized protein LOC129558985 [Moschus berezovskii]|uniref:uncharacterized protein LOC129558985 n=1 Tax=Moschus berezovskii TaxID=68408 RepID=UPI002443ACBE|nr:uncharacterized protein LOC129558985 [Moschus berezovskii]
MTRTQDVQKTRDRGSKSNTPKSSNWILTPTSAVDKADPRFTEENTGRRLGSRLHCLVSKYPRGGYFPSRLCNRPSRAYYRLAENGAGRRTELGKHARPERREFPPLPGSRRHPGTSGSHWAEPRSSTRSQSRARDGWGAGGDRGTAEPFSPARRALQVGRAEKGERTVPPTEGRGRQAKREGGRLGQHQQCYLWAAFSDTLEVLLDPATASAALTGSQCARGSHQQVWMPAGYSLRALLVVHSPATDL